MRHCVALPQMAPFSLLKSFHYLWQASQGFLFLSVDVQKLLMFDGTALWLNVTLSEINGFGFL